MRAMSPTDCAVNVLVFLSLCLCTTSVGYAVPLCFSRLVLLDTPFIYIGGGHRRLSALVCVCFWKAAEAGLAARLAPGEIGGDNRRVYTEPSPHSARALHMAQAEHGRASVPVMLESCRSTLEWSIHHEIWRVKTAGAQRGWKPPRPCDA